MIDMAHVPALAVLCCAVLTASHGNSGGSHPSVEAQGRAEPRVAAQTQR